MADTPLRQRIRGQETEVRVIKDSVLQDTITKITQFEVEAQFEVKSQGYLGGITEEKDEIYNGCKFSFEMHLDGPEWLDLQASIKKRAQRLTPDVQFTIVSTLYFPSGDTRIIVIPNARFGAQPLSVNSRADYVSVKCEGEANDFNIQSA